MTARIYYEGNSFVTVEADKIINDVVTMQCTEVLLDGRLIAVVPKNMLVILTEEKTT